MNNSRSQIKEILSGILKESTELHKVADDFLSEVKNTKPDELSFDDLPGGDVDAGNGDAADKDKEVGKEVGAPKKEIIKTPEDAKKVLNEAVTDLQAVVDNLDGICGQAEEELDNIDVKRVSASLSEGVSTLASTADAAIADTHAALKYWSFLKKAKKANVNKPQTIANDIANVDLKNAAQTILEVQKFSKIVESLSKESTAVPPTGAEFSGDKNLKKDPVAVEQQDWRGGAEKFKRDKSFEDSRPNPAVDTRLNTTEYPRDEKPHVNAHFVSNNNNKFASYWDVVDDKSKKRFLVQFASLPDTIGERNDETFKIFQHPSYGISIATNVTKQGAEKVRNLLGAKYANISEASILSRATLSHIASVADLKDKTNVRKYYADAFGDGEYAREMTSSNSNSVMNTGYDPKDKHVRDRKTDNVKDGAGALSSKNEDPAVIKAKAKRVTEIALGFAAVAAIPFTKKAVYDKANELMKKTAEEISTVESTLKQLPVRYPEALKKNAHIPDTETGIIGNSSQGVSNPKATVDTEDMNKGVESDAKIASIQKIANIVPQLLNDGNNQQLSKYSFSTLSKRLSAKGVNPKSVLIQPHRRKG